MKQKGINFDDVLEKIGSSGRYQAYNIILIGLAGIPPGAYTLANVFLSGQPEYTCTDDRINNTTVATDNQTTGYSCYYERKDSNGTESELVQCSSWEYNRTVYEDTIVTEWDLVCSNEWKVAFSQSSYMLGFMIGCIAFGSLSDSIGRKKAWFLSLLLMILSGTAAAFMPNYWTFIGARVLSGTAAGGAFTIGFVITVEVLGVKYRTTIGIFYQGWFSAGYMILPLAAYFIRNFRHLQLLLGLVPILFVPYFWLLGESPRWLMAEGKIQKASVEVRRAVKMNRTEYPVALMSVREQLLNKSEQEVNQVDDQKKSNSGSFLDLWRTPNMRKKTLNACFNWLVNSMVFYGLSLGSSRLVGGPYINLCLSGLMEFPAFVIAVLTLDRLGRRPVIFACLFIGGLCCLFLSVVPPDHRVVTTILSMLGKLSISGSFSIIYVYHAELSPTVVRNVGVGTGSMCARIGGIIAPFVALLGYYWRPLPPLLFGVCALIAAILSLFLPETVGKKLPDTIEEGELFGRDDRCSVIQWLRIKMLRKHPQETESAVSENNKLNSC